MIKRNQREKSHTLPFYRLFLAQRKERKKKKKTSPPHQKGKFVSSRKEDPPSINMKGKKEKKTTSAVYENARTATNATKSLEIPCERKVRNTRARWSRSFHHPRVLHIYTITGPACTTSSSSLPPSTRVH